MTPPSPDTFARSEIALAYTFLWGACLHSNEENRTTEMLQARKAYMVAVRYGGDFRTLERPLRELADALENWSLDRRDEYRTRSLQYSAGLTE